MGLLILRYLLLGLVVGLMGLSARADDILFFGNSFTFADMAPMVMKHGGVPKLVEEIAKAKGKPVETTAVTKGGKGFDYHLEQPKTAEALAAKVWTWVVLQDYSTRPTAAGNVPQFMKDGETFSDRIAVNSPKAGIVLYETWSRPAGGFYKLKENIALVGPEQMMSQLHQSYGDLQKDLAAKNANRPVVVAPVGTAFAEARAQGINMDAKDNHHATAEGYYLAALVIYETIYHDSAKGAPAGFFKGEVTYSPDVAAKLQAIADEVCAGPK